MSLDATEVAFVRELVYQRSAIVLDDGKDYLIEARLEPVASAAGFASTNALVGAARSGTAAVRTSVVEALTTNETSFFRDLAPFECLRREVLPRLAKARAAQRTLTIWCAACSTGQEPYSIAMLILEHFPELARWPIRIIATDLAEHVLTRAREGRFQQLEVNRGLPATMMLKYFERQGTHWHIKHDVRRLVEFSQLNLVDSWSRIPPRVDIVFMRNVLIYFDQNTKKTIMQRLGRQIASDGALFLGAAETTLGIDDQWERVPFERTAYSQVRQ
jgi:chemotaxis protein methyltransferase CheR